MDPEVCPNCEKVVYDAEGFPAGKLPTVAGYYLYNSPFGFKTSFRSNFLKSKYINYI